MDNRNQPIGGTNNFSGGQAENVQAQNIEHFHFQGHQQGINSHFAGRWQERMHVRPPHVLSWDLRLNGTFTASFLSRESLMTRLAVKEWYGDWRVALGDPENAWIELAATDLDSPGQGFLRILTGQPEQKTQSLARLTRSANMTSYSQHEFTLSWTTTRGNHATSTWRRIA